MLFDAAVLTAILGAIWLLVRRLTTGSVSPGFGRFELRSPGLFIGSFGLLLALTILGEALPALVRAVFPYFYLLSYLLLVFAVIRNWHLWGMRVALLGVVLNLIVVAANGGRMPVDAELLGTTNRPDLEQRLITGRSQQHSVLTRETRLSFLADVHVLPSPYPRPCVFSVGDVFITLGACWLILTALGLVTGQDSRRQGTEGGGGKKPAE